MEPRPFRFLRNLGRSREIATVLLNYGFGDLVERLHLRRYLQWGRRLLFWRRKEPPVHYTRAERIRMALETLGATFVKFGQIISTRPDLVPPDVIQELSRLQEEVRPFPTEQARAVIESELGAPVESVFAEFDSEPIAAASLAQVHWARHRDGTPLAVKIRRPNVVQAVERDLSLMSEIALLTERHIPEARLFDPVGLVNHFARTIRREMNFNRESRSMNEFARLFRNDSTLRVPRVYWDFTSEAVLTMEYIDGVHIRDKERLKTIPLSTRQLAINGARIFMRMAFELGIFHGDPHPGNIRILPDGSVCLLDYGMIGMIGDEKREQLVDLFLAINRHDTARAVEIIQRLGTPREEVDKALLQADVRDFVENYYAVPLERMDVGNLLSDFVSILSEHGIHCPADLMLLIRALITLEGTGLELDPKFNMAEQLAPFVERVVRERYNLRRMTNRVLSESRTFLQLAHSIPLQVGQSLEKLSRDDLRVQLDHQGLDHLISELDRSSNRLVIGMVMSALILASALIIRLQAEMWWFSVPLFVLSSLLGVWLIYGVFRSGRL